jgi:ATPase subunit of ABC transporter with duplicated ATPase domains
VIAVAHDRYFIENFATAIWELRDRELNVTR